MQFRKKLAFLSNFYPSPIVWGDMSYPTVEHAFQASKTFASSVRERIRRTASAGMAKRLGRSLTLRKDWEEVKIGIMKELLALKFTQHSDLRHSLLATRSMKLVEGTWWHDNFWGDCYCDDCKNKTGKNILGKLLMELRESLKP